MEVIIDGKPAMVKPGTSFEYVAENRAFTKADSYTMEIIFPIKGCQRNIDIFGHLHRQDAEHGTVRKPAEIVAGPHFRKKGVITVVSASDTEIKGQFLEGRSVQNFDKTFDDIYIDEMDLSSMADGRILSPANASDIYAPPIGENAGNVVYLPWYNTATGTLHNKVSVTDAGQYEFSEGKITPMAYLYSLTWHLLTFGIPAKLGEEGTYHIDLTEWAESKYVYLLCCNTLPDLFKDGDNINLAYALPHWTLTEYLEELESFLGGFFDIDHDAKTIAFHFYKGISNMATSGVTELGKVVDEYSAETDEDSGEELVTMQNVEYEDPGYDGWEWLSCQWFIDSYGGHYAQYTGWELYYRDVAGCLKDYYENDGSISGSLYHKPCYIPLDDTFYMLECLRIYGEQNYQNPDYLTNLKPENVIRSVNIFAPYVADKGTDSSTKLKIVPVRLDYFDFSGGTGHLCIHLDAPDGEENDEDTEIPVPEGIIDTAAYEQAMEAFKPASVRILEAGEPEKDDSVYSNIFVAYWDGNVNEDNGEYQCPIIDRIMFFKPNWRTDCDYSLRLSDRNAGVRLEYLNADLKTKYTFKFLSDSVPDPTAVFSIRGKRYLCGKITATISEDGLSRIMEGEFYRCNV